MGGRWITDPFSKKPKILVKQKLDSSAHFYKKVFRRLTAYLGMRILPTKKSEGFFNSSI